MSKPIVLGKLVDDNDFSIMENGKPVNLFHPARYCSAGLQVGEGKFHHNFDLYTRFFRKRKDSFHGLLINREIEIKTTPIFGDEGIDQFIIMTYDSWSFNSILDTCLVYHILITNDTDYILMTKLSGDYSELHINPVDFPSYIRVAMDISLKDSK